MPDKNRTCIGDRLIVTRSSGTVNSVRAGIVTARLPGVALGDLCEIETKEKHTTTGIVVSFSDQEVFIAPHEACEGIYPNAPVYSCGKKPVVPVGPSLLGTVLDALGKPLRGELARNLTDSPLNQKPPKPLTRTRVSTQLYTGVPGIDLFCPLGYGQRLGLLAPAGTGKSTLLGMIARNAEVDVAVICLVGERGREVNEFIQDALGEAGLQRSVVVLATSDESPLRRASAASTATAIAEGFRSKGKRVLLLVDSLTRYARALREIGLLLGEVPVRQGYTPRVYTELPQLLERAGTDPHGSITAIYSLLIDGPLEHDPLSQEIISLLDGHVLLSRELSHRGIYPAIDVPHTLSRLQTSLSSEKLQRQTAYIRKLLTRLQQDRDTVLMGGTPDSELQTALIMEQEILDILNQQVLERVDYQSGFERLSKLVEKCKELQGKESSLEFESRSSSTF